MPERPDQAVFDAVPVTQLPGFASDTLIGALPALEKSCKALTAQGTKGPIKTAASAWRAPCQNVLQSKDAAALRAALLKDFSAYAVSSAQQQPGLFTGYFLPLLEASKTKTGDYQTPLYARPNDLVEVNLGEFRDNLKGQRIAGRVVDGRLKPYADRAAIDGGVLAHKGLELYWAKDPVAVFFLHIQGSGVLQLPDGSQQVVGFAAQNGHPYKAIGKELISRGALTPQNTSMQTIAAWLAANPAKAAEVMQTNPSYIFFRKLSGGALGAANVELTPGRSLAVDNRHISYHLPLWLDTTLPDGRDYQRLMVAQDTGGAILGVVRGDVFFGAGEEAAHNAGLMKQPGRYYILVPKGVQLNGEGNAEKQN